MKSLVVKNKGVLKCCFNRLVFAIAKRYSGKSDGKAGAINQAGGAFKQMGAAKENQFFYKKERELIENLRQNMKEQLEFHEEEILKHQQAIERIKKKQRDM
ncbi:hypothetical protein B5X24_HaOG205758 [Helicoverpa armigera]|uniref:Uncharacterized protein n=1 Tax=Helicoverpa armigera TaxID=29058 RepID=A0A2W1BLB9_HELAM|nr:hypothetical protein B5X24_HaOG205758 [Helicoverpa armigera]